MIRISHVTHIHVTTNTPHTKHVRTCLSGWTCPSRRESTLLTSSPESRNRISHITSTDVTYLRSHSVRHVCVCMFVYSRGSFSPASSSGTWCRKYCLRPEPSGTFNRVLPPSLAITSNKPGRLANKSSNCILYFLFCV